MGGIQVNVTQVIVERPQIRGRGRRNFRPWNHAATAKIINKLVKRAINRQTNQSQIQGPSSSVGRRRATALVTARVPITFARRGARRDGLSAGILRGVSERSRVIGGNAARRARAQLQQQRRQIVIDTSPKEPYGRRVQQPRVRFLDREPETSADTDRRNARLLAALGVGQIIRNRRSDPERFESSESFLPHVSVRRGRGFNQQP